MKIENVKTGELIPYARNAKLHSDQQVQQIAGSIREFGFNNPVLIDADNGIIAGHGRVLAAQLLKLDAVPCIRLAHLTETQKKAYILADNRLSEIGGGWNESLLKLELEDLKKEGFDAALAGFDLSDFENELSETEKLSKLEFSNVYYEPEKKPNISLLDCINLDKFNAKLKAIEESGLKAEDKEVLKFFAYRFIRIDFENVANYYFFNASEEEQKIMERLRLVLCDSGIGGFIEDDILKIHETIEDWRNA
jgi:hypothetical protein